MAIRAWLVVSPLDLARKSVVGGWAQLTFGQLGGMRRIGESDGIVLYAPRDDAEEPLRSFVAVGRVDDSEPYRAEAYGSRSPWRRRVSWMANTEVTPIRDLVEQLDLTRDRRLTWGEQLREGLVEISLHDFDLIEGMTRRHTPVASSFVQRQMEDGLWVPQPDDTDAG